MIWVVLPSEIVMRCRNPDCPFSLQLRGNGESSSHELSCLVSNSVKEVTFSPGDFLFSQDQPSCCVYVVNEGVAKILSVTPDGHEHIVGFANPRKLMVGLRSLSNSYYSDSAVAETSITACKIRKRALLAAVARDPTVAFRLIDAMNAQLAMSRAMIRAGEHHGSAAKIAAFLLLLLPQEKRSGKRYEFPYSRREIADILGLSEETVCRQMARMKRKDILYAPRGSIEIHDWDRLREIADERQTLH